MNLQLCHRRYVWCLFRISSSLGLRQFLRHKIRFTQTFWSQWMINTEPSFNRLLFFTLSTCWYWNVFPYISLGKGYLSQDAISNRFPVHFHFLPIQPKACIISYFLRRYNCNREWDLITKSCVSLDDQVIIRGHQPYYSVFIGCIHFCSERCPLHSVRSFCTH